MKRILCFALAACMAFGTIGAAAEGTAAAAAETEAAVSSEAKNVDASGYYRKEVIFDDLRSWNQLQDLDPGRPGNYAYSDEFDYYSDGTGGSGARLSTDRDHTTGSGKSLFIYNKFSESKGTYVTGRLKLFNMFKDSPLTEDDIGKSYKISFWLRIDNIAVGSLKLAALDTTSSMNIINSEDVVSMSAQESEDSYGEWIKYDYTMTTGEDITTLGFVLFGGYLDGGIDDISVEKIKPVTVTYETNGGSKVAASKAMTYDYIVPPVEPEKEGYVFEGWYSDRELKNRFNFKKQCIVANMVLYAKWIPVKETVYKDVYSFTESEQTIETEIPDKHLDEQIIIRKNDTVKKTEPVNKTGERQNILQFIIIAAAAIVVIAGGTVAVILLRRKRKDGRK